MGTEDRIDRTVEDAKGRLKEGAGGLTGDESLQAEGRADRADAAAREAGEKVKEAARHLKEAAERTIGR